MLYPYRLIICLITVAMTGFFSLARANDSGEYEPMALRTIMQEMSDKMQLVTDAIAREQWSQVAIAAPLIGDHRQPPFMEKTRILGFVGGEAGTFRSYDKKTQEAAQVLKEAALAEDGVQIIDAFASLQKTCLSCHQRFRQSFVAHFYD